MTNLRSALDGGFDWQATQPAADARDKVKILLVDDNEADLALVEGLLAAPDYVLVRAASGAEALRQIVAQDFAAIVLDGMMPAMDGFETARQIKKHERAKLFPIIFLTANAWDERLPSLGYEAGAVDYLTKPVDGFVLKSKVAVFADLFRAQQALRREVSERERLAAQIQADQKRRLDELEREKAALLNFAAGQPATPVTARLSGELLLQEGSPQKFTDLRDRYAAVLEQAVDGRVHVKHYNLSLPLEEMASEMAFLGAGPKDVVDVHKAALAKACDGRPEARVRVTSDEARFLLVELMGYLAAVYRSYYRRQVGAFNQRTPQS